MSPLQTFIRYELKRLMANVCRAFPEADEKAVRLSIAHQLSSLKLAEVQPEDEQRRNRG